MSRIPLLFVLILLALAPLAGFAEEAEPEEDKKAFNLPEMMFHHVLETHDWHLVDIPKGGGQYLPVIISLPWIVYSGDNGLDVFMLSGHTDAELNAAAAERGYTYGHGKLHTASGASVIDISISKTVLQMMLIAALMLYIFIAVAKGYKKNEGHAPKGVQSFFEPVILFVIDDICKPNLRGRHQAFAPYMLTLFFFIAFSNLLGLTPLNSNIMGNISITAALATLTFILINANTTATYWQHIFWFPGVPVPVKFIMLPVELVGMFARPFALLIRLFANITAGHFMMLALIGLIFLLGKSGESVGGAVGILPMSLAFGLFIMTLEVLVALVQAYVFKLLTSVFIGMAMESHDDHY